MNNLDLLEHALARLSVHEIALLCGVVERTVRLWIQKRIPSPKQCATLRRALHHIEEYAEAPPLWSVRNTRGRLVAQVRAANAERAEVVAYRTIYPCHRDRVVLEARGGLR